MGHFLNRCGRAYSTVGKDAFRLVALSSIRKQVEQEQVLGRAPPWFLPQFMSPGSCLDSLPWLPWILDCYLKVQIN